MSDASTGGVLFGGTEERPAPAGASEGLPGSGKQVFRAWDVEQGDLLPAMAKDLVAADHLVHVVRRVVREELDLAGVLRPVHGSEGPAPLPPGPDAGS